MNKYKDFPKSGFRNGSSNEHKRKIMKNITSQLINLNHFTNPIYASSITKSILTPNADKNPSILQKQFKLNEFRTIITNHWKNANCYLSLTRLNKFV